MAYIRQLTFERLLSKINFSGGGFFGGGGVSSASKKEYIKAVVDDSFERFSEAREYLTLEEWDSIIEKLRANKKDVLNDKDIDTLDSVIRRELKR